MKKTFGLMVLLALSLNTAYAADSVTPVVAAPEANTASSETQATQPKAVKHKAQRKAARKGMTDEQREQHAIAMQEHQLKVHDLSNKILAESDPAKKEQLKKEQRDLIQTFHDEMHVKHHALK